MEIIGVLFVIYLYTRIVLKIKEHLEERRSRENIVENIESRISSVLKTKLEELKYPELRDFASEARRLHDLSIEYKELKEFSSDLRALLTQARRAIEKEEHKIKIAEYEREEYLRKREIEELDKRIYLKQLAQEDKKREMMNQLKAYEHPVFRRDSLNEKQVVALMENGYSKVNEYCIIEKKLMTFLIDPVSNHSKTHTFLVWNVKELLKRMDGVEKIQEMKSIWKLKGISDNYRKQILTIMINRFFEDLEAQIYLDKGKF